MPRAVVTNYPDASQRTEFLRQYEHNSPEYLAARKALYWCLEKLDACLEEVQQKKQEES